MSATDRQAHWQNVYTSKGEQKSAGFRTGPRFPSSLLRPRKSDRTLPSSILAVAPPDLSMPLDDGYSNLAVLDLSEAGLASCAHGSGLARRPSNGWAGRDDMAASGNTMYGMTARHSIS